MSVHMKTTRFLLKPDRNLTPPHTVVIDVSSIILAHLLGRPYAVAKDQDRFAPADLSAKYNGLAETIVSFVEACMPPPAQGSPLVVIVHGGCPPRSLVPHHRRLSYMSAIARRLDGVVNDTTDALPASAYFEHVLTLLRARLAQRASSAGCRFLQESWINTAVQRAASCKKRGGGVRFIGFCDETILHALSAHMRGGAACTTFQFCTVADNDGDRPVKYAFDSAKLQPSCAAYLVPALILLGAGGFLPPLNNVQASEVTVMGLAAELQRADGDVRRMCKRGFNPTNVSEQPWKGREDPWASCMTLVRQNDHKRINLESATMGTDSVQALHWKALYYKLLFGQAQTQEVAASSARAYVYVLEWTTGYVMGTGDCGQGDGAAPMYTYGYSPQEDDIAASSDSVSVPSAAVHSALDPVLFNICVMHPDTGGSRPLKAPSDAQQGGEDARDEAPVADAETAYSGAFSNHVRYACVDLFPAATTATTFMKNNLWDCVPNIPAMDTDRIAHAARRIKAMYSPQTESQPSNCILRRLL